MPRAVTDFSSALTPGRSTYAGWAMGLAVLFTVIAVIGRHTEIAQFLALIEQAKPQWLVPALAAQGLTYVLATAVWWFAMHRDGHRPRLVSLIPLGVAKLFIDQILPSGGISGTVLVTLALERRNIARPMAIAALFIGLVSFNAAYLIVVIAACLLLWLHGLVNPPLLTLVSLFSIGAVAIPAVLIWMKRMTPTPIFAWTERLPGLKALRSAIAEAPMRLLHDKPLLAETIVCQLGVFLLDAVTFWLALRTTGISVPFWIPFSAFIMASVAATIGPIPLGLGTFEAAAVALLSAQGISPETALTATLLFRGLSFWLPMAPGLMIVRRELHRRRS